MTPPDVVPVENPIAMDSMGTVGAACLTLGLVLKRFPALPNNWIPVILVVFGVGVAIWEQLGKGLPLTPGVVINGLTSAAMAVGIHGITSHTVEAVVQKAPETKPEEPFIPPATPPPTQ